MDCFCVVKHILLSSDQPNCLFLKGNAQFLFLCNPPKSGNSKVSITFLQVTQNRLTKDIFNWLELITEILSFLKNIQYEKNNHSVFLIFLKTCKKIDKKTIFLAYVGPLKVNYRLFLRLLTLHCFFLTLIAVFYMYNTIYLYLLRGASRKKST